MKTSDSLDQLAPALAKAQGEIEGARKTATNPHLKSKYANLADVWDACRQPLTDNGLAVIQCEEPAADMGVLLLTTRLLHASGQWVEGTAAFPVAKADAQGHGAALTYARRYGLSAMVGVCPDDDDDGHSASQRGHGGSNRHHQQEERRQAAPRPESSGDRAATRHESAVKAGETAPSHAAATGVAPDPREEKRRLGVELVTLFTATYPAKPKADARKYVERSIGRAFADFGELTLPEIQQAIDDLREEAARATGQPALLGGGEAPSPASMAH